MNEWMNEFLYLPLAILFYSLLLMKLVYPMSNPIAGPRTSVGIQWLPIAVTTLLRQRIWRLRNNDERCKIWPDFLWRWDDGTMGRWDDGTIYFNIGRGKMQTKNCIWYQLLCRPLWRGKGSVEGAARRYVGSSRRSLTDDNTEDFFLKTFSFYLLEIWSCVRPFGQILFYWLM